MFFERLEQAVRALVADVVVGGAHDVEARRLMPSMRAGSAEKIVPLRCHVNLFGAGFSKLASAMSAPLMRSRTAPLSPVRRVRGTFQPNEEQQTRLVISAVPPSNGKSAPLPFLTRVS